MLLAGALMTGAASAQSSSPDTPKDSTSQQGQSQQGQQPQPAQPNPPAQVAPGSESKSESRTDYRSDTRSERIVETERGKFLGMDPTFTMIIGAVLFIVIVMAMVAMSRKSSNTTVETRRTI
jgi:hypothetical protein